LKRIRPAVDLVKSKVNVKEDYRTALDMAIQENAKLAKKAVMESIVVDKLIKEGKLAIITAEYYFETGLVKQID